jgi:hypothetical protein
VPEAGVPTFAAVSEQRFLEGGTDLVFLFSTGASSNVGQASRRSPSKNPPHYLVAAGQPTKPRLKAIIQSQRPARRLSYGMWFRLKTLGHQAAARFSRPEIYFAGGPWFDHFGPIIN